MMASFMRTLSAILLAALVLCGQQGPGRGRGPQSGIFHTDVPAHLYDLTLGRPEASQVTATVLAYESLEGWFDYAGRRSVLVVLPAAVPVSVVLDGLQPDTPYPYRFHYRRPGAAGFEESAVHSFHTRRKPGSTFTFAVQADSHLDENTDTSVYRQTLENIVAAKPDFLVDLGDTFMTDKHRPDFRDAFRQYVAQRYYFGLPGPSVPLFLVLGNHDGEDGSRMEMAAWSLDLRTRYFPNPRPDGFYTGNPEPFEDYYAWEWGDALFIVLDPFRPTTGRGSEDNWYWTLGTPQYNWLKRTLEGSRARFRFVLLHHPTGAKDQPIRGGVEAALYNEWGGRNADGTDGFAAHRPGWAMPVHQLLVKHGVSIIFHGHDHLYAREVLDGVVYQEVPQPGNPRAGVPRSAEEYGYTHGGVLGGAGYLLVRVSATEAAVDYVLAGPRENGRVAASYLVRR